MTNYKDFLNEQLQNEEFKKEYDALEAEFSIIQAMLDARKASGLTQKDLQTVLVLHRRTSANWKTEMPTLHLEPCKDLPSRRNETQA